MAWVWQLAEWPNFIFDPAKLQAAELEFHHKAGEIAGAMNHFEAQEDALFAVELLSQEAVSSSSIEGETLNRDSVKSSIRKQLGLKADVRANPNEIGVAELMVDVYAHFQTPLEHKTLFSWHEMLMNGRRDLEIIGEYRQHAEPMQIISGNYNSPKVFYEAPPSTQVEMEMDRFLEWYHTSLNASDRIPTLVFAGIVHLYFEMIHPFEDGNGRIGRALVEKAFSQRLGRPALHSLAKVIDLNKKTYYNALQACNIKLNIDDFLAYFAKTCLEAQDYTIQLINFTITKAKFFAKYSTQVNERQMKVLLRMFEEGIEGFKGGLSAKNYQRIANSSPATTTRDLQDLVTIGALLRVGELKGTRYFLGI